MNPTRRKRCSFFRIGRRLPPVSGHSVTGGIRETGGFRISKRIEPRGSRRSYELGAASTRGCQSRSSVLADSSEALPEAEVSNIRCPTCGERPSDCEKVYVINLEREPGRWSQMEQELRHILDSSGAELLSLTERHVAVDANAFSEEPPKDADIDPFYSLGDQLFVEPQPLVFPTRLELDAPIRMSRAEVAVARSHINVWRRVSASNHAYVMILEDDAWFHSGFARCLDRVWDEVVAEYDNSKRWFDVLYVSYLEAKHGAPKAFLSNNLFRPVRGLWHLSGYVLSREGAAKLLQLLPCRGPIDLWINHQFEALARVRLNEIKQREQFRPIAPVCLEEDAARWFGCESPQPIYALHAARFYGCASCGDTCQRDGTRSNRVPYD